ncbi:MAG: cysteine synthase family protein [Erysipelotrichaceae bacterium]|nr:cysteine synthase family protein [Erysipelotrichaceae bacterium]
MTKLIGNTPIYQIENTNIYVKLEKFNPGGSIKDRSIVAMLEKALRQGDIKEDTILVEAVTGNIGVSLALWGAIYKIPVIVIAPDTIKSEKRKLIQLYGAQLILTKDSKGMLGAIEKMEELLQQDKRYFSLRPFDNEVNINIHYETTGSEILEAISDIDIFVTCTETAGSFMGISKRLKAYKKNIRCILGEPENCSVVSGHLAGKHTIEGVGVGFIPSILDDHIIDDVMLVSKEDALKETISFIKETGIMIGLSSGANIALAKRLANYYPQKKIVTIAPDGGDSTPSFLDEK